MSSPVIVYPPELPVSAAREEIATAIRDNQVVIVAGATGSGKTTQLPKICLELGHEKIAHTQPRRLAARTIAERVAEELHVPLGDLVGYKVRFTDQVSDATRIALMTDGILLNEIHRDRLLRRYDTIIIDEAHERSLNVDFLLGYLHRILPERPDLKVIITSATIDPESFAAHFSSADGKPAPIVEVSGRTYPVEIRYRALVDDEETGSLSSSKGPSQEPEDEVTAIVKALRELDREPAGDVLVFLPGEAEIRDAAEAVRGAYRSQTAPVEVLPLYGRLSAAEQHRVFEPSKVAGVRRRVILATNVAETSLTVPGIKYVIDTGTARISRYSNRSKVQRLPIEAISQASANQRSGRAGRTSDGIAIRLYSEDDFDKRPEFTEPEILRTSLASVVLQMLSLGFGDIAEFPFLTPPDSRGVKAALDLLGELGAVETARPSTSSGIQPYRLTGIGRDIARMPMDPRFARMLVEASRAGVTHEVLPIVAGLSIQDVRERPSADAPQNVRDEADRMHARFADPTSDFLALLNLWNHLREKQNELGSSAFRRMCRSEHLNYVRVREWFDVHRQLKTLVKTPKTAGTGASDPDAVHRALLAGLLSQIGILDERTGKTGSLSPSKGAKGDKRRIAEYRGARGIRFSIFPGSGLRKQSPQAVMAAEIVETSRTFARTVAKIDPAWAEALAGDLAKRQVSEPHWSKDAGAAVAFEKVTLFGVEIIPRRRVQFARIDRPGARELFLRHALVEGEWDPSRIDKRVSAFWRSNAEMRKRLEKLEERERRRDILAGDEVVFRFYDERIPSDVYDVRSFEKWWREALAKTPKLLVMRESDLVDDERADKGEFPTRWPQGDQVLGLAYRFEPGASDDGVSVVIPLALLQQVRDTGFDWQVPGLRAELITALLRALPKAIRRHVVPAADWADKFGVELADAGPESHNGIPPLSLAEALAKRILPLANQLVSAADFEMDRVPPHLRMNFRAVDERGRVVGSSRDLRELQERLAGRARQSVAGTLRQAQRPSGDGSLSLSKGSLSASKGSLSASKGPTAGSIERTGITTWNFGDLPEVLDTKVAGGTVRGYPALVDAGKSVSLRVEATADAASAATRTGILRLVLLNVPSPSSYVQEHLTSPEKLALAASPYQNVQALIEDCRTAVVRKLIDASPGSATQQSGIVRSEAEFARVRDAVNAALVDELFACVSLVARILTKVRDVERGIKQHNSLALLGPLNDIRSQLSGLVHPGFASETGVAHLAHLPRYLDGILLRLRSLADAPGKDRTRMTEYERMAQLFADAGGAVPVPADAPANLVEVRWLLEEYRVSLFAQALGTAQPVSPQRITKALAAR